MYTIVLGVWITGIVQSVLMTRLRAGRCGVRFPIGKSDFSLLHNSQSSSGAHPASYPLRTGTPSPRVKWQGCEVTTHLHLSVEVKHEWRNTSTSLIRLHYMERDNEWPYILFICELITKLSKCITVNSNSVCFKITDTLTVCVIPYHFSDNKERALMAVEETPEIN
jgi:hypothetical protein